MAGEALKSLVAAVLGAALAGEALTPVQLVGFAEALAALVAGQLAPARGRVGVAGRAADGAVATPAPDRRNDPVRR